MKVKVIVLRDETRTYRDRTGATVTRRQIHAFPAPDDGAAKEMDIVLPLSTPPLTPYAPAEISIKSWRAYDSAVVFEGEIAS